MKRRDYIKPTIEIVEVQGVWKLMTGSPLGGTQVTTNDWGEDSDLNSGDLDF